MKSFMFKDIEGNLHTRSDVSYHHVIAKTNAHGQPQKRFVKQAGLLLPMLNDSHNKGKDSLHANVPNSIMPNSRFARQINQFSSQCFEANPFDRFLAIATFIGDVAVESEDTLVQRQAIRLADNLAQQAPYILQGQVEIVFAEKP